MRELRQVLDQQLRKLEAEQELINQALPAIHRRKRVLEEISTWNLLDEEVEQEQPQEFEGQAGEPEWAMSINEKAW